MGTTLIHQFSRKNTLPVQPFQDRGNGRDGDRSATGDPLMKLSNGESLGRLP
jgi:hypothetical protein